MGDIEWSHSQRGRYNVHISSIFEDAAQNLWLCTNDGVYVISNQEKLFNTFGMAEDTTYLNFIPSYRGFYQSNDSQLFICSYGGLYLKSSDSVIKITEPNNTYCPYSINEKNGLLWIATEGAGMMGLNPETLEYQFYHADSINARGAGNYLTVSKFLNDSVLLLGDYTGLFTFNIYRKQFAKVKIQGLTNESPMVVKAIEKSISGLYWLATSTGIFLVDEQLNLKNSFTTETELALAENAVNVLLEDSFGNFWIGYKSSGISHLNVHSKTITHYTTDNGLADNRVAALQLEQANILWVSTNDGLSRLNIPNGKFDNFFTEDGLSNNEFNHGSSVKLENGDLIFGGVNGFVRINKGIKKTTPKNQQVFLSNVEFVASSGDVYRYMGQPKTITLPYSNRYISVSFGFSDYGISRENHFSYKMEGLDEQWRQIGTENTLRFAALPHGKYRLRVKGAPYNGAWGDGELVIPITVEQVFYKTWWFITLLFGFLGTIAYYIIQQRIKKIKEISQMRASISSDLHDEVGSVLTKVAMEAEILEEDVDDSLKQSMLNIAHSCRHAMSTMRDAVWSIDSRNVSIGNLFDKFNDHCQLLFESSKFSYTIKKHGNIEDLNLGLEEKKELLMIFKRSHQQYFKAF